MDASNICLHTSWAQNESPFESEEYIITTSQRKEDRYVLIFFDMYMGVSVCTRKWEKEMEPFKRRR